MNCEQIQDHVYNWAIKNNFDAPYGVLVAKGFTGEGKKYLSVTFGRARTLDATVKIYNRNFIILRTSRENQNQVFKNFDLLMSALNEL